jgi:tRNA A-37 threonylcarbamoyl transferase component Bud32
LKIEDTKITSRDFLTFTASGESGEEDVISEATDDCDNVLVAKLNFVALQVHNQRLKKRLKRKRIVKEFGLLNKARDLGLPRRLVHFYLYV